MLILLKSLHLLALAIGLGLGVAGLVIGAMSKSPEVTRPIQRRLSRIAFAALILLWITGLWMVAQGYTFATLSLWFWLKMVVVVAMTGAAVTAQVLLLWPRPDTPALLKKLTHIVAGSAALAVILAVLAFA